MCGIRLLVHTSGMIGLLACMISCRQTDTSGSVTSGECRQSDQLIPFYNTSDFTPIWLTNSDDVNQKITHRIADFSFLDQTDSLITQNTVTGKIHVANFFFTTCPNICPKITNLLKTVQDTFRHDPRLIILSFSVTPWLDSVSQLRRYANQKGIISEKWHLLTGERGRIYDLARRSYFAEEAIGFTKDSTEFLHTEHLILIDQNRRIRGIYNGTLPLDISHLIADIQTLLQEK